MVNNDNEPVKENIPDENNREDEVMEKDWSFKSVYYRKRDGNIKQLVGISMRRDAINGMKRINWFLLFFPMDFVKDVILPATNNQLQEGRPRIAYWEYLRWLGIWLLLATSDGYSRNDFFQESPNGEDLRFD